MSWIITGTQKNNWTPADIDTALWLDAADASTITESGGAVSQWDDKSGNGRHVTQATAADQPIFTANAINGRSALAFDGVNDGMSNTSAVLQNNVTGTTFFAVTKLDVNTAETKSILQTLVLGGNTRSNLAYNNGSNTGFSAGGRRITGQPYQQQGVSPYSDIVTLNCAIYNYNAANLSLIENGTVTVNAATFQNSGNTETGGGQLYIGSFSAGGSRWDGYMAEIICIHSAIPADIRQKIEGYLAHKWGLTANLPADHPYKTAVPVP
jgi:hypothetical protein